MLPGGGVNASVSAVAALMKADARTVTAHPHTVPGRLLC